MGLCRSSSRRFKESMKERCFSTLQEIYLGLDGILHGFCGLHTRYHTVAVVLASHVALIVRAGFLMQFLLWLKRFRPFSNWWNCRGPNNEDPPGSFFMNPHWTCSPTRYILYGSLPLTVCFQRLHTDHPSS